MKTQTLLASLLALGTAAWIGHKWLHSFDNTEPETDTQTPTSPPQPQPTTQNRGQAVTETVGSVDEGLPVLPVRVPWGGRCRVCGLEKGVPDGEPNVTMMPVCLNCDRVRGQW